MHWYFLLIITSIVIIIVSFLSESTFFYKFLASRYTPNSGMSFQIAQALLLFCQRTKNTDSLPVIRLLFDLSVLSLKPDNSLVLP